MRWRGWPALLLLFSLALAPNAASVEPSPTDIQGWLDCSGPGLDFAAPLVQGSCYSFSGGTDAQPEGTYGGNAETVQPGTAGSFVLFLYGSGTLYGSLSVVDVTTGQTFESASINGVSVSGSSCTAATRVEVPGEGPASTAVIANGDLIRWSMSFAFELGTNHATLCSGGTTQSSFQTAPVPTGATTTSAPTEPTGTSTLSTGSAPPVTSGGGLTNSEMETLAVGVLLGLSVVALWALRRARRPPPPPPPVRPVVAVVAPAQPTVHEQEQLPRCGPDVTKFVLAAMKKMMDDFFSWDKEKQRRQLGLLTGVRSYQAAWDMDELSPPDEKGHGGFTRTLAPYRTGPCMKPDGSGCDPSVEFLHNCHHPQVVNYVMWGVLARLEAWDHTRGGELGFDFDAGKYSDSALSNYHWARSGTGLPLVTDENYKDQKAMATVGYELADRYIRDRWTHRQEAGHQYDNSNDLAALQAVLESEQNSTRKTASCLTLCGPFVGSPIVRRIGRFSYIWGDIVDGRESPGFRSHD